MEQARHKRSVSPSLRAAARLDGDRVHGESSFRIAAQVAMATLDSLADTEEITSNAYNSMAKRLKLVYDSRDAGLRRAKRKVVIRMAAECPTVLLHAPVEVDWVCPDFVRSVLITRASLSMIDDEFLDDMVETFLGDPYMDLPNVHVRNGILSLLEADAVLLGSRVLEYLSTVLNQRKSADIFGLCYETCNCEGHNRALVLMDMAAKLYPNKLFHSWLIDGLHPNQHAALIKRLRASLGVQEPAIKPGPTQTRCVSPSLAN